MNPIEAEALAAVHGAEHWAGSLFQRHHQTSAAHTAATATIEATTGGPVSLPADLHAIAARLETIGEDGVEVLTRVKGNPETAKVLAALDELTGFNVQPGIIDLLTTGLGELLAQLKNTAPAAPAGPQVAGQA